MDDDKQKRPLDPSDFEDELYDDEFAFDENDPAISGDLSAANKGIGDLETTFEDTPENWGDFEDPALSAVKPGTVPGALPLKKKSFIMKHFNTIIIGVGVVLGAGVMMTQFVGGPTTPSSEMVSEETATGEALPQPSPIAPVPEQEQAAAVPEEKLTPMPEAAAPAQNLELAPLDPGPDLGLDNVAVKEGPQPEPTQTAPLEPIEPAVDVEKAPVELPDPIAFENQPIPTADPPSLDVPAAEETPTVPKAIEPVAVTDTPAPLATPAAEEPAPVEMAAAPEATVTPPAEEAPKPLETPPAEDPKATGALEKLNADNTALSTRNKDLENQISGANSKIEELASMLADMEKKIAALESAPPPTPAEQKPTETVDAPTAAAPEATAPEEKEPENILVPAKPTKRPENVPEMKKEPAKTTPKIETKSSAETPRWVLRSAQNGRAVVSDRSSGDLRSIEIGDTLRGIGKIQSISAVNGRWVVQGSQGAIKQ